MAKTKPKPGQFEELGELRIEARLRNNVLYHVIFDNFRSVSEFTKHYGLSNAIVGDYLNLANSPLTRKQGVFKDSAVKIARAVGMEPAKLFPVEIYGLPERFAVIETSCASISLGSPELKMLAGGEGGNPFDQTVKRELAEKLEGAMKDLRPAELVVVRLVCGFEDGREHTFDEIGKSLNLSKERVRQIFVGACRKIRSDKFKSDDIRALSDN